MVFLRLVMKIVTERSKCMAMCNAHYAHDWKSERSSDNNSDRDFRDAGTKRETTTIT